MDELESLLKEAKRVAEARPTVQIGSPDEVAARVMYDMMELKQEELWVVILDTRNVVMDIVHLYKGSLNTSLVRTSEIFKDAIVRSAKSIVIVHNHPSGDPTPSSEDTILTLGIASAGKTLDIELLDHIVIGAGTYISMRAMGLGFSSV